MPIRRSAPFLFVFCLLLAAMPLVLSGDAAAQPLPVDQLTPADGPGPNIPPISTIPPQTPAGVPTTVPNPNQPPPTVIPQPDIPTPTLVPIFPTEEPEPTAVEIVPGSGLPRMTPPMIPTPGTGVRLPEVLPATITIRTRVCDNQGFNPYPVVYYTQDLTAIEAECPLSTEAFAFSLYTPTLALSKVTSGGSVTFTVEPYVLFRVDGVMFDGYDAPVYLCKSSMRQGWGLQSAPTGGMNNDLEAGESLTCTWFFVKASNDINLVLEKDECHWFDPGLLEKDVNRCDNWPYVADHAWGDVTVSDTNPSTADIVLPASGQKYLYVNDLAPGTYTVTETKVTAGTAWTYLWSCWIPDEGSGASTNIPLATKGTSFALTLDQAGNSVFCTSYNVMAKPSADGGTGVWMAAAPVLAVVAPRGRWEAAA